MGTRRMLIGILIVLHGIAHLLGFLTSWDLIEVPGISRTPTVFADDPPVGVMRDIGVLWVLGAVAFVLAGYGALTGRHWWKGVVFGSAVASFCATILWIHEAWPGTLLNGVIIAIVSNDWWERHHDHEAATRDSTTGNTETQ